MGKVTYITLVTDFGLCQDFEFKHAERILRMGRAGSGGWHIPEGSRYKFDEEDGSIRVVTNKGGASEQT